MSGSRHNDLPSRHPEQDGEHSECTARELGFYFMDNREMEEFLTPFCRAILVLPVSLPPCRGPVSLRYLELSSLAFGVAPVICAQGLLSSLYLASFYQCHHFSYEPRSHSFFSTKVCSLMGWAHGRRCFRYLCNLFCALCMCLCFQFTLNDVKCFQVRQHLPCGLCMFLYFLLSYNTT